MAAVQLQPVPRVLALLLAGLFFLALARGARHNSQVVFPRRVQRDQTGSPWRGDRGRVARDAAQGTSGDPQDFVFYRMDAFGKTLLLRLTPNKEFLSRSFQTLTLSGDGRVVDMSGSTGACFYSGTVESFHSSSVVLSTCSGLMGLIKVNNEQMLIEPLSQRRRYFGGRPHRIYRRELPQASVTQFCGTEPDDRESESEDESRQTKRSAVNNIDARQRTVEALVVLDKTIVKHHGRALVKTYALTVMSMVNSVISLPSIGHNINIAVTKLVILEEDQVGLKLAHHADSALHNFCQWQREKLPYVSAVDTDTNEVIGHRDRPSRHDAAILLTRKDICKDRDEPCGTLGMAFISGMCDPNRMCSVNEDNGLTLAFTVAHELGHNLGMNHDGMENRCVTRPESSIQYIMSSSWLRRTGKVNLQWSPCSRSKVENFLRSQQSQCLLDTKRGANLGYAAELPGELYTPEQQCVFIFGKNASVCPYPEKKLRLCESLWCIEPGKDECVTKEFAAVDGTECGQDKWCKGGRCEYNKDPVHGGWGNWTDWSGCSRTCGTGVRFAARKCDSPFPEYGGDSCGGDRVKYEICNTQPCPEGSPSFRSEQCAAYRQQHARQNKTKSSLWFPVYSEESPCSLLCRAVSGRRRTVTLSDRVIDGTPCSPGKRALCVDGQCKRVGCDDVIGSDAEEDQCGVCRGNGTTCHLVRGMYQHHHGTGYEEIVVIPKGARRIRVMEARPMRSYLAVKDSVTNRYVNGGRRIELPKTFKMAGTKVQYTRKDLWETFTAEGPLNNSLQFLILQQDPFVGVVFEYTVDLDNASHEESPTVNNYKITTDLGSFSEDEPTYGWIPDGWEDCDAVCGGGIRRGRNRCMQLLIKNRSLTFVEDESCQDLPRPHQKEERCNKAPCETKWRMAGWLPCSVTCGEGTHRRVVACTQQLSNGTLRATHPDNCEGSRPPAEKPCRLNSCPLVESRWKESSWGQCTVTCGGGIQSRLVRCVGRASDGSERYVGEAQCQEKKPAETRECSNRSCEDFYEWRTDAWSPCSASCGPGVQLRNASCVQLLENDTDTTGVPGRLCFAPKPDVIRNCTYGSCPIKKWEVSAWAGCSVSCGQGMQSRDVTCMTSYTNGTVLTGDDLCDIPKPAPVRSCGFEPCPISESWEATPWHACSVTCGQGIRSRRVRCKVTYPNGTMVYAPDVRCNDTDKLRTLKPCFGMECAAKPIEIVWSKCSTKCGPGERTRRVKCHQDDALCKVKYRAVRRVACYGSRCNGVWKTGPWSKCSVTCGYGLQHRSIRCKTDRSDKTWYHNCNKHDRPDSTRSCSAGSCVNAFDLYVYPLQPPNVKEPRRCNRDQANPRICRVVKTRGRLCRHTHWAKNCCRTCGYYEIV